jgi:hypothetical protein
MDPFWQETDALFDQHMARFADSALWRKRSRCAWDRSETVVYGLRCVEVRLFARVHDDDRARVEALLVSNRRRQHICFKGRGLRCGDLVYVEQQREEEGAPVAATFAELMPPLLRLLVLNDALFAFCHQEGYACSSMLEAPRRYQTFLYKHRRGFEPKLRLYFDLTAHDDAVLGELVFFEPFRVAITARPAVMDLPFRIKDARELASFIRKALLKKRRGGGALQPLVATIPWFGVLARRSPLPPLVETEAAF